jgi:hypothetical protein
MRVIRFPYTRSYRKRGVFFECRWFLLRFYPPVLPSWTVWRR